MISGSFKRSPRAALRDVARVVLLREFRLQHRDEHALVLQARCAGVEQVSLLRVGVEGHRSGRLVFQAVAATIDNLEHVEFLLKSLDLLKVKPSLLLQE